MISESFKQVIELAESAGEAILEVYRCDTGLATDTKSDRSPVTEADMCAHRIIVNGLKKILPGVPVLSEEGVIPEFAVRSAWTRYWLVDPLDGTKEFIGRNGEFTVNIALIENHIPVFGVVHVPVENLSYFGMRGKGAFRRQNGELRKIVVRSLVADKQLHSIVVVASRSHRVDVEEQLLQKIERKLGNLQIRRIGSSLKFCLIAEGIADFYPRLAPTCEWDTAAAQAVLEAAGGAVVDRDFRAIRYNTGDNLQNPFFYAMADPGFNWAVLLE